MKSTDDTRCPYCRAFYPSAEISTHKRACGSNPANQHSARRCGYCGVATALVRECAVCVNRVIGCGDFAIRVRDER